MKFEITTENLKEVREDIEKETGIKFADYCDFVKSLIEFHEIRVIAVKKVK